MRPGSRSQTAVHDRLRPHDLALFVVALALVVALPWMLMSAGSEPVEYRDQRTGSETTVPAWAGVLWFVIPFLVWPAMKAWNLIRKPAAATLGPGGIRLYREVGGLYARDNGKKVNLGWDEVQRIVLWRKRTRWLWLIPGWTAQVGVEKPDDWYEVSRREPTEQERKSRGHRKDGSPIRLGAMLNARSIRLGPVAFKHLAEAVATYAPQVEIVDERVHGKREVIRPSRATGRS
ncbi:hypothetical protein [Glycomyces algeriensis]|uniref:Uncharacterized protein n=1 Tax=Glycomyces algeriensis TaxID=256037 RepID=A0A9W6LIN1_9ACTN|nr:hypothetical protein [Glycomyces algeriensis]MDA1365681.1 hypothetical protein [Glycomyces algeriensis]MDR7351369.1 hypothetical protein [Glycomyces algeriensis]GLI44084.1 hypothetical protein GALLR39Z86_39340 [Glycomyces algeriensis]